MMLTAIREWADEYGGPPSSVDWSPTKARHLGHEEQARRFEESGRWPWFTNVVRVFGRWNVAIIEAGFEPRRREDVGLKWREIGERLGLDHRTVSDYYHDPTGTKHAQRLRDSDRRLNEASPCPRCGGPKHHRHDHCKTCEEGMRQAARRERMDDVAQLWNEGATLDEIKAYMGYGENSHPPILSEMMALGMIQARREGYRRKHAERDAA
jgi:hypothetical protein